MQQHSNPPTDGDTRSFTPLAGERDPFHPDPSWHPGPGRLLPLTGYVNEAELADVILDRLERSFDVHREVTGRHPAGVGCRIDAVLVPREPQVWKRQDIALGVEFKALSSRKEPAAQTHFTAWMAQAIDYAHVEWHGWGRLPIFMCPSPFAEERFSDGTFSSLRMFANGLLGQYGVGFLALYEGTGLSLVLQGRHRIWSERHGVEHGRRWALRPHIGSRH